jgi:hypothetical protein
MAPYNSTFTNAINKTAETVVIAEMILKLINQHLYRIALETFFKQMSKIKSWSHTFSQLNEIYIFFKFCNKIKTKLWNLSRTGWNVRCWLQNNGSYLEN